MSEDGFGAAVFELVNDFCDGVDWIDGAEDTASANDAQVCDGNEDVVGGVEEDQFTAGNA